MEENEQSIDLRVLLKVLRNHLLTIIGAAVAAAIVGFVLSAFVIPKKYTSEAMMYVENSADKNNTGAININDITAAQKIVNTCQILFTSNYVLEELKTSFGEFSVSELRDMIVIESVDNTEILRINVTSLSPQTSNEIAQALVKLSENEFRRVIKNGSIEVVSAPTMPTGHTFPSVPIFTAVGLLIGLAVSYVIYLIVELVDVKVKPGDDLMQLYGIPVFAEIMDFELSDKGSYKYHYYATSTSESDNKSKSLKSDNDERHSSDKKTAEKSADKRKEKA